MGDFSRTEYSFALPAMAPTTEAAPRTGRHGLAKGGPRSYDVQLDEVAFRRLHAADEIQAIHKLRDEIQLPGKAVADPAFLTREKKETGRGWSVPSNGMTTSSGR